MAWEPPNQEQHPNTEYGGAPQNPYGPPPQNPGGAPQNPYGPPPQNPYGAPQNQYGYGPQNPYGTPSYDNPNVQSGYAVPPSAPLPLGEALRQLPNQYIRVVTKPSAMTFEAEMGKAAWDIVWVQLIIYAVIGAILGFLASLISTSIFPVRTSSSGVNMGAIQAIATGASFGAIITIPLFFFIGVGILYLIAKAFHGQGTFLQQCYSTLLFQVPLGILASLLALIPFVGGFVGIVIGIYEIVLQIFAIMAVHRLSGGKATAVVLIPIAIGIVLFIVAIVIITIIAVAAVNGSR